MHEDDPEHVAWMEEEWEVGPDGQREDDPWRHRPDDVEIAGDPWCHGGEFCKERQPTWGDEREEDSRQHDLSCTVLDFLDSDVNEADTADGLAEDSFVTFMDDDSLVGEDSFNVCHNGVDIISVSKARAADARREAAELQARCKKEECRTAVARAADVRAAEDARREAAGLDDYLTAESGTDLVDGIFYARRLQSGRLNVWSG